MSKTDPLKRELYVTNRNSGPSSCKTNSVSIKKSLSC